jgi:arsenate reductase-like glutaredoxin family protein
LRGKQLEVEEINYAKTGLTEAVVKDIVAKVGGVEKLLNTRHATVKDKGWVAKPPSVEVFAKAVAADVNVLKRPIFIDGARVIVGFDKDAYGKLKK